jgi:hypothetical protein
MLFGQVHPRPEAMEVAKNPEEKHNCILIGEQIDGFRDTEIPFSDVPARGVSQSVASVASNKPTFLAEAAQLQKGIKGGFFATSSNLSFLDIYGLLRQCQVISPEP